MENYIGNIISGLFLLLITVIEVRANKERKKVQQERTLRKRECLLSMDLTDAYVSLACATAIAVRDGKCNGEMTAALSKAEKAQEAYYQFIDDVYSDKIAKIK